MLIIALLELFAQMPELPDVSWWSNWGPLGVLGLIVASIVVAYFWMVDLPHRIATQKQDREHMKAKQEIEIERERKSLTLLDTLRVGFSADQGYKQRQAATSEKMTTLIETMVANQQGHSQDCAVTKHVVQSIASKLQLPNVAMICQGEYCQQPLVDNYHLFKSQWLCDECFRELTRSVPE